MRNGTKLLAGLILVAAPAAAETVTITAQDCERIESYVPSADVAYVPGRDVNGGAVAPADLDPAPKLALPEEIEIPITIRIDKRYGIPATPELYRDEAYIGTVVWRDGRLTFNGQPLATDSQAELIRACRDLRRKARPGGRHR